MFEIRTIPGEFPAALTTKDRFHRRTPNFSPITDTSHSFPPIETSHTAKYFTSPCPHGFFSSNPAFVLPTYGLN